MTQIKTKFAFMEDVDSLRLSALMQLGTIMNVSKGEAVAHAGSHCETLALVLEGTVRVYKIAENGRELTLYRVDPGESCVLTASCVLSHDSFPAEAIAETNILALMVPAMIVRKWVAQSEGWREYVFSLISQRLSEVIAVVEEVAFRRMDQRIAGYLLKNMRGKKEMECTHQELAAEIGTAREVVTRVLRNMEQDGAIALGRGCITILDIRVLEDLKAR